MAWVTYTASASGKGWILGSTNTLTNLAPNPSFETDTTGWSTSVGTILNAGATLTRITTDNAPGAGTACAQVVCTGGLQGIILQPSLSGTVTYTFAVWLKSVSGSTSISINIGGNSGTSMTVTITTSWAQYFVTGLGAQAAVNIYQASTNTTFLADGITITTGTAIPAFFDGNSSGGAWTGTANESISTQVLTATVSPYDTLPLAQAAADLANVNQALNGGLPTPPPANLAYSRPR